VEHVVRRAHDLDGARVLITAGPTREFIDPSRFLSNPSTGRMGLALAQEARARGASVTVICGPTQLRAPADVAIVPVTTAREMHAAVMEHLPGTSIFIGAAAVADFRPAEFSDAKIKKESATRTLALERNPDIIAEVSTQRPPGCYVAGFAAETDAIDERAREKLTAKQLDCIVVNRIDMSGGAFAASDNEVTILWGRDGRETIGRAAKIRIAGAILDRIIALKRDGRTRLAPKD
jgi:phosphopantothenoylcysteine decarboxylase / phosphopantothenate---cysteine ligase